MGRNLGKHGRALVPSMSEADVRPADQLLEHRMVCIQTLAGAARSDREWGLHGGMPAVDMPRRSAIPGTAPTQQLAERRQPAQRAQRMDGT